MIIKITLKNGKQFIVDEKVYTTLENYLTSLSGTFISKSCVEYGKTDLKQAKNKAFAISEINLIEECE